MESKGKTSSITDFGAMPNGEIQTQNIQNAIDHAYSQGGGTVIVPKGVFLTGGVYLRSNVRLHLLKGAELFGSRDIKDYMTMNEPLDTKLVNLKLNQWESRWNNCIIKAVNAENIAVIGEEGSKIDGQNCYDSLGEEK